MLIYLNEWPEGGETVFPAEGPEGLDRLRGIDYKSCAQGLKVKPLRTGDALLFYSVQPSAAFDKARRGSSCTRLALTPPPARAARRLPGGERH